MFVILWEILPFICRTKGKRGLFTPQNSVLHVKIYKALLQGFVLCCWPRELLSSRWLSTASEKSRSRNKRGGGQLGTSLISADSWQISNEGADAVNEQCLCRAPWVNQPWLHCWQQGRTKFWRWRFLSQTLMSPRSILASSLTRLIKWVLMIPRKTNCFCCLTQPLPCEVTFL